MHQTLSVLAVIAFVLVAALVSWLSLWIIGDRDRSGETSDVNRKALRQYFRSGKS